MNKNEILRKIPQVDYILKLNAMEDYVENIPHDFLVDCIRKTLDEIKQDVLNMNDNGNIVDVTEDKIVSLIKKKVDEKKKPSLRKIINATGVVLHTNLGRAVLSKKAVDAMMDVAHNYSNLEYDVEAGDRGDRHQHTEEIIKKLTGCEACMVVTNNAAATMIVLAALAENKEVIVSRGELIEIGGSFRIPDIMEQSNAKLKEVGTTNKTKISDYKKAYVENETAAIMKVHTSNYKIIGFTEEATTKELKELTTALNIPLIYDMGNGLFVDLSNYGIDEPNVPQLIEDGADVILFSGDKLLGGPQAGIIIGKEKYISKMKKHPLARALRVDKFTIAALTATLFEYYDDKNAKNNIPVLKMITITKEELKNKTEKLYDLLKKQLSNDWTIGIEETDDQVGGGTTPNVYIKGYAISLSNKKLTVDEIETKLRCSDIPIITRISHNQVLLNTRTIFEDDFDTIVSECKSL